MNDAYFEVMQAPAKESAIAAARAPVPRPAGNDREMTKISEILKLRRGEAAQRWPVKLRGVMTYADPAWRNGFIQDETGAVYFDLGQKDVHSGQWVELTGETGPGGFAPEVLNATVRVLGTTNLPAPIQTDLVDLANGQLDAHWVELTGVVRRVEDQDGHWSLIVMARNGKFTAILPNPDGQPLPAHLVDALVRIQGACSSDLNIRRQLSGITLQVPDPGHIQIIEPSSADPFTIATTPVEAVATFDPDHLAGRRVKVTGVVTLLLPGEGFFLQDDSGGLRVQTPQTNEFQVDDWVEALGFPAVGDFSPHLKEASFRRLGPGLRPAPRKVRADQVLLAGTQDGLLVEMEARLVQNVTRSASPQLVLRDGPIVFIARWEV